MEIMKLNIDTCIMIHDLKQIAKEPPQKKIKTKNQLSIKLAKKLKVTRSSVYSKIDRYEKDGFKKEDTKLVKAILSILDVSREELVSETKEECYKSGLECTHSCKAQCRESC